MPILQKINHSEDYYIKEFEEKSNWVLDGLALTQFSMITGLNSVGKTRTCNVIKNTFKKIAMSLKPPQLGTTDLVFKTTDGKTYKLLLSVKQDESFNQVIKEEKLYEIDKDNSQMLFDRKEIFDCNLNKPFEYSPPDDSLTFHARRDKVSYPYIENIINDSTKFYFLQSESTGIYSAIAKNRFPNEIDPGKTPSIFHELVTEEKKKIILDEINSLEFPIEDIIVRTVSVNGQEIPLLLFKEKGVGTYDIANASSGMKTVIFLITCLNLVEDGACVLIDNLGDGLDHKRSMEIVPVLEEKALNKQIIVSTNNEILLNQTDIRNWNILHREGHNVKAYNYLNNRERLTKFADSGLSNYEYFMDQHYL